MMSTLFNEQASSGKRTPLLTFPPLRTGRVPLKTSGSSTSRTTRLLFLILLWLSGACVFLCQFSVVKLLAVSHCPFNLRMDVLMTEQVNQYQVAVVAFAPL